jgi:hypothetical protein
MSIVRQNGGWTLERSAEGVYLIAYRGRTRTKVVTADYTPVGPSDERNDRSVPVREVSSVAGVEEVFAAMASGDAFVPVPAGVTRSGETTPPDALPDLPLGGVAFVGLLAGACFAALYATVLHPVLFAVGILSVLVGAVVAGVGYRECRRHGPIAAVQRLHALGTTSEESRVEDV